MALDVFEVQTGSLGRPQGAAYRFAWHLASDEDNESWEVWSDGNCFLQTYQDRLVARAQEYIASEGLGATDAGEVMQWVEGLPWRDGVVTLHMAW